MNKIGGAPLPSLRLSLNRELNDTRRAEQPEIELNLQSQVFSKKKKMMTPPSPSLSQRLGCGVNTFHAQSQRIRGHVSPPSFQDNKWIAQIIVKFRDMYLGSDGSTRTWSNATYTCSTMWWKKWPGSTRDPRRYPPNHAWATRVWEPKTPIQLVPVLIRCKNSTHRLIENRYDHPPIVTPSARAQNQRGHRKKSNQPDHPRIWAYAGDTTANNQPKPQISMLRRHNWWNPLIL